MMGRAYLKIPIALSIIKHHCGLSHFKSNNSTVHPKNEQIEFSTYKEKVLFILNKIRKQFGKEIIMRQPNFDLAWCAFIIENDYL
jgi:hypothetical protein